MPEMPAAAAPAAVAPTFGSTTRRVTAVFASLLALATIGCIVYVAAIYEVHTKVIEAASSAYENPSVVAGWAVGALQFLRSAWSYWVRVVFPVLSSFGYRQYTRLLRLVSGCGHLLKRLSFFYDWFFLAAWAGQYGYSKAVVYKGPFAAPHWINFDPLKFTDTSSLDWSAFVGHSTGTINLRRLATSVPKRLVALWAMEGTTMRLIGMAYVGDEVLMCPAHVVTGNGGVVHYLKLGITVVVSCALPRARTGMKVVPLPKAMCTALVKGTTAAWLASPPPRSDKSFRPGDDHCLLRFPNVNSLLGVKVTRSTYASGKGSFVPIKVFEYEFDEVSESYVLYEQLGRIYDKQPCKGALAGSYTSVPGMSGSILFDPLTEALVGMNIGTTVIGAGTPEETGVSVSICIRQIYVYWTQVEPCLNAATFSWPRSRPTMDQHSDGSSTAEGYWEIDEYEMRADELGHGTDFEAGDWETADERANREHRERDAADVVRGGQLHLDYSIVNGAVVLHCGELPEEHFFADTGRLSGFGESFCGPGACICCGVACGLAFCLGCSAMLNLQHTRWSCAPVVPEGFLGLSPLEMQLMATLKTCVPEPFAADAAGVPFLFAIGQSTYVRRYNNTSALELPPADLLNQLGVAETYHIPDRSEKGILSSLYSNVEKRKVGNFGESANHWCSLLEPTADRELHFPVELPHLGQDLWKSVRQAVFQFSQDMKLDKSAGWSGALLGCPQKVDLITKHQDDVLDMATSRIVRFLRWPTFAAELGPLDLVRFGFRGVVLPEIKGELHPDRKVLDKDGKRLAHPRWRSILMQDTADHLVHMFFEHGFNRGLIENFQTGALDSVIAYGSLVGMATNAEGIERMQEVLTRLAGPHLLRTSDVSGMDWCLGASDVLAAAAVRAQRILHSNHPHRQRLALGSYAASLAESRSVYLVGGTLYAGNEGGVCQTGAFSTSEIDGFARVADARLSDMCCEVLAYGDDSARSQLRRPEYYYEYFPGSPMEPVLAILGPATGPQSEALPMPGYVSALDERELVEGIDWLGGDPANICSRDFSTSHPKEFTLTSWPRCITRLAGIKSEAKFAESAGGLLVECRYTQPALERIAHIASYRGFSPPTPNSTFNIDGYVE